MWIITERKIVDNIYPADDTVIRRQFGRDPVTFHQYGRFSNGNS